MTCLKKYACASISLYLLLCLSSAAQAKGPFTLSLSADSTVKAGADVYVKVAMQNISDQPIDCSVASSNAVDLSFRFRVRDESGNPLKKKVSKHPELEGSGSIKMCTLAPGQSTLPEDNLISNLYDLTNPGKYTIQALRAIGDIRA